MVGYLNVTAGAIPVFVNPEAFASPDACHRRALEIGRHQQELKSLMCLQFEIKK